MLKLKIPKLRLGLNSKGNSSQNTNKAKLYSIGRSALNGIPVLSIFALVGIFIFSLANVTTNSTSAATIIPDPSAPASASLSISGAGVNEQVAAGRGTTAYRSHTIKVTANNISDYAITISGPANMTSPSGGNTITATKGTKTGANLTENTWGYGWGTTSTANASLIYKPLSTAGTTITTTDKPSVTNNAISFDRKLVFAAKFSADTTAGRYYANNVQLSLTVSPKTITLGVWNTGKDSGIAKMQDMTVSICNQASVGNSMYLQDSRDGSIYSIAKLKDGNCWMASNLTLDLSIANIASASGSDGLSSNWPTTALVSRYDTSMTNVWENSNTLAEFTKKSAKIYSSGDGNGYQSAYGYYYSWCAATADTCDKATINNMDASASICPKGWKLPKGGDNINTNNFVVLANLDGANITEAASNPSISWSSHLSTAVPATMSLGGTNWYRAGYVNANGAGSPGTGSYYWTRTAYNDTRAYGLLLFASSQALFPANRDSRYYGYPIRCIMDSSEKDTHNYKITYNCNSGSGCPANLDVISPNASYSYTIPSTTPTRSAYNFLGYNTSSTATTANSAYAPGKTISLTSSSPTRTLYAIWQVKPTYNYKVTYDCNGGSGCPSNLSTTSTDTAYAYTIPNTTPTRSGYRFLGYSTSSTATAADSTYAPNKTISLTSSNPTRTLYAVWRQITYTYIITFDCGSNASLCPDTQTITSYDDTYNYTLSIGCKAQNNKSQAASTWTLSGDGTILSTGIGITITAKDGTTITMTPKTTLPNGDKTSSITLTVASWGANYCQ